MSEPMTREMDTFYGVLSEQDRIGLIRAREAQQWSPDPSTQIGVCIVTSLGGPMCFGPAKVICSCNHFPLGIAPRLERPEKYVYIEHAERNAIYHAAKLGIALEGATLYMIGMGPPSGPCDLCARAIIQAGIKRVVAMPYKPLPEHWDKEVGIGTAMLIEAGIEYVEVPAP